jgi:uncharacterized membrane protein
MRNGFLRRTYLSPVKAQNLQAYAGAALIGTLAGMRSMAAPAVIGQLSRNGGLDEVTGALTVFKGSGFSVASAIFAGGELIADKLPMVPNRTAAGPLLGRALTGGLSGAVVCSSRRRSVLAGALIGAAFAIGAAYGAYELRKLAGKKLHLPDVAVALGEDAIVGALGIALTSRLRGERL